MNNVTSNAGSNLKITGNRCQCGGCREVFNSLGAFDKHRTGKATDRTCRSPSDIGMSLNATGYWVISLMSPAAKARRT